MTTTTLNVDNIATDADLYGEQPAEVLDRALPNGSTGFLAFRQKALQDVVDSLAARRPPVYESDLVDPTELRAAVVYRALVRICRTAITMEGDVWTVRAREYQKEYSAAIDVLRPTVSGGAVGPGGGSISVVRR